MTTATFDTYSFIQQLTKAGMTTEQAEIQSDALKGAFEEYSANYKNQLATKQDLKNTELMLTAKILDVKAEIIKWVGGMLIAQVAVAVTLFKLLS